VRISVTVAKSPISLIDLDHGGTLSLRKLFAHHYRALMNYTYSKSIDLSTDVQLTGPPTDYLHSGRDRGLGESRPFPHRFDVKYIHRPSCDRDGDTLECWPLVTRRGKPPSALNFQ